MSADARASIMARIATAVGDVPDDEAPIWPGPVPATTVPPSLDRDALTALFAERVAEYRATVTRVDRAAVPEAVAAIAQRHGAAGLAVPADLPAPLRPAGVRLYEDDPPLDNQQITAVDGVLTGCALAIADTGTIVLDGGVGQGRRALTFLPDLHVCVVLASQVVQTVPQAMTGLAATRRPVTLISGPSATSDIELIRVEGVHGPRRLEVLLVD